MLTHPIYSHTYLFFSLLYSYKLSSTDNYFPNKRERMKEISHCPLNLKMSDFFRKAHLDLTHIVFFSAVPDFQEVGRRRSSQNSLTEIQ